MRAAERCYICNNLPQTHCFAVEALFFLKAGAHESYLLSQQPRVAVSSADSSRVRCGYREQCATRGGEQNIYRPAHTRAIS